MGERAVMVLAATTWVGARLALPVPGWTAVAVIVVAYAVRRPWVLFPGVVLLASSLGAAAHAGLAGLEAQTANMDVALLTDPERFGDAVRVEVRVNGRHVEAWAEGSSGDELAPRLAGDRVSVRGRVEPLRSPDAHQISRHLAGRLEIARVRSWQPGGLPSRLANGYRSLLTDGSRSLSEQRQSLLAGLALGDDRSQSPAMVDAFRGAGLTHLLAVSGQNVAFVLLVVEPLLRRLPVGGRIVLVLAVLAMFGMVTRFEPSVLRATAMAAVAVVSTAIGRPAGGRRALALAVTGLLLIDPLLVYSVGFALSVAASLGIVLWSAPVAGALPAPGWIARPCGVIVAAQLAVAPVLVATFGPLPMASVPANLLAGPAAGPAMVWGMTAGAVAGVVPDAVASLVHLPTDVLLGWIELVARIGAALPLGGLGPPSLALVLVAGIWWRFSPAGPRLRRVGVVVGAIGLLAPVARALWAPVPIREPVAGGAVWRSEADAVLVVADDVRPVQLLGDLRRARVRGLDLIAAEAPLTDETIHALWDRFGPVPILAGDGGSRRVELGPVGSEVRVGSLVVVVRAVEPMPVLDVLPGRGPGAMGKVRSPGALGARAPPLRRDPSGPGDGNPQSHSGLLLRPGSLLGVRRLPGHR